MIRRRKKKKDKRRRGIYILPNLFTTASLFSGFYSIISAIQGSYYAAAVAILVSCIFDMLDGRVARLTHTTSRFGVEYDSLSDLVAFGVAPGILAFLWALQPYRRFGWLAAFLYVATCALRLARFNTQVFTSDSRYFNGLPCPAAASLVATSVLFLEAMGISGHFHHPAILAMIYVLSYLMVSTIRYHSMKSTELFQKKPFHVLVTSILLIIVVATEPDIMLFVLASGYVVSGPLLSLFLYKHGKLEQEQEETKSNA